jgi:hypothetical protein
MSYFCGNMPIRIVFVFLFALATPIVLMGQQWKYIAPMKFSRANFGAVQLDDGRFLVAGGRSKNRVEPTAEIYDPRTDKWITAADMNSPRVAFPLVKLIDGRVYAPSGLLNLGTGMNSASDIYDPVTDSWSETIPTLNVRSSYPGILLPNGKVLLVGGDDAPTGFYQKTCEIFDPVTETIRYTDEINTGQFGNCLFLDPSNQKVININDHYNGQFGTWLKMTEEYDIATEKWSVAASSQAPHGVGGGQAVQLPNGDIIAPSGSMDPGAGDYAATDLIEIYSPNTHSWRTSGKVRIPRFGATSAYIGGDSLLIVGGYGPYIGSALDDCEIINLKTGAVTPGPKLNDDRMSHRLVVVREDDLENPCREIYNVYVFGGESTTFSGSLSSCEMITFNAAKQIALSVPNPLDLIGAECAGFDTTVMVRNNSCSPITIDSLTTIGFSNTSISMGTGTVAIGDSLLIHIINTGSTTGKENGSVTIYYHSGTVNGQRVIPITTSISGTGVRLSAPQSLSATATVCNGIDTFITITNRSCDDLTIDSLLLSGLINSTAILPLPMILASGASTTLTLNIHELMPGLTNGSVKIFAHSSDTSVLATTIISIDLIASIRGKIRSIIADQLAIQDSVELPIYLNSNTGEVINGFELTLEYNTDLLIPITPNFSNTLTDGTGLYDQNSTPSGLSLYVPTPFTMSSSKPLIKLRFLSFVTDTNCTLLRITNLRFDPDNPSANFCLYQVTSDSAVICRVDDCGDKLLRNQLRKEPLMIYSIDHDSKMGVIKLHHSLIDADGAATIFDQLGRQVLTSSISLGATITNISSPLLRSGVYFVLLTNGHQTVVGKISIYK